MIRLILAMLLAILSFLGNCMTEANRNASEMPVPDDPPAYSENVTVNPEGLETIPAAVAGPPLTEAPTEPPTTVRSAPDTDEGEGFPVF